MKYHFKLQKTPLCHSREGGNPDFTSISLDFDGDISREDGSENYNSTDFVIKNKQENGFIALISAIIISAILLAILFTANASTFFARFDSLDTEYKRIAVGLAESCANEALLKLAQNYSYDPDNEIISVGSDICHIKSITPGAPRTGNSTLVTINTQANHQGAFSAFQVEALVQNPGLAPLSFPPPPNIKINSWQEIPSLP